MLNANDPIAMHLLMETAMGDSKNFKILSYEELEDLKRERNALIPRVEATKKKLALESKLRDAAQSMQRLYSVKGRNESIGSTPDSPDSPRRHRRNLLGSRTSSTSKNAEGAILQADGEYAASTKKCEELTQEVNGLQYYLDEVNRKILEHTAGVLQMTHRGLKKNIRKGELPRSPESMVSGLNHRSVPGLDGIDDFDERSFYRTTDFNDGADGAAHAQQSKALQDTEQKLNELSIKLRDIIVRSDPDHMQPPPPPPKVGSKPEEQIQAHLGVLTDGLETIETKHAQRIQDVQHTMFNCEDMLDDVNVRLHDMLEKTNSTGQAPLVMPTGSKGMESQLGLSTAILDKLNQRMETLVEQKTILTQQIQQQRDLNSKSDAQRDAQITDLTSQLSEAKQLQTISEKESQASRDQINLLMEKLDSARQEAILLDQHRNMDSSKALQAEKNARQQAEEGHLARLKQAQDQSTQLQADMTQLQTTLELQAQKYTQQINHLTKAKETAEIEAERFRNEMKDLESEVVRVQTDLTVVRAELDGAYGTRAQRAADVSMNPAIQKEIDDLNDKNSALERHLAHLQSEQPTNGAGSAELQNKVDTLQKELRETIEDYEVMTRASIEFEKERDQLEANIDALRERTETLEAQLSDEKIRWLGAKGPVAGQAGPMESTSTMILKNEFKKMMRDTRMENVKALKVGRYLNTV